MPKNGWKWVTLAVVAMIASMAGAYLKVVPSEVPTGVIMAVIGLFVRSPIDSNGNGNGNVK